MLLFKKRVEGGAYLKDEDWTLPSIVKKIRSSDVFTSLTRRDKYSKELTAAAMKEFFKTNAFYIGALGSLLTHNNRRKSMLALGVKAESFDRIQGPVGLQIGSKSPAEIALSILAAITTRLRIEMS